MFNINIFRNMELKDPLIYFFITVVSLLFFSNFLTNSFTPSGDGNRIFLRLVNYQFYESLYPLYNHFVLGGGVPFIAEPERFFWLSLILDTQDRYFNLKLNMIFLSLFAISNILIYTIFRKLNFSIFASFTAMLIFSFSDSLLMDFIHGRLNNFISYISTFITVILFIKYQNKRNLFILFLLPFLFGIVLQNAYYYSLMYFIIFLIFVTVYMVKVKNKKLFESIIQSIKFIIIFSLVGLFIFSFIIFPVIDYAMIKINFIHLSNDSMSKLPYIEYMYKMFSYKHYLDDYDKKIWYFRVPFFIIPIILIYLIYYKKIFIKHEWKINIFFIISMLILISFLLGRYFPFSFIIDIWNNIPILNKIRHALLFYILLVLFFAIICAFTIDMLHFLKNRIKYLIICIIVFLQFGYLFLASNSYFRGISNNYEFNSDISSLIKKDKSIYYVYNDNYSDIQYDVHFMNFYSTITPNEYRVGLEMLYNKKLNHVKAQRVYNRNSKIVDPNILSLLNIKYLYIKSKRLTSIKNNLKLLYKDKNRLFLENLDYKNQFKSFNKVICTNGKMTINEQIETASVITKDDKVLLDMNCLETTKASNNIEINDIKITNDTIYFTLSNMKNEGTFLQVPVFYDKDWYFYINGEKHASIRSNGLYNGVFLKDNVNNIKMKYEPISYYLGIKVSILTILLWTIIILVIKLFFYKIKRV